MFIRLRSLAGALALSALVLTTAAHAASSTPAPPPATTFSKATKACMKQASNQKKLCKFTGDSAGCSAQYNDALKACFAAGKGVSCANSCVTKKVACDLKAATSATTCKKDCKKSPDPLCKKACSQPKTDCKNTFSACLLKCPQL